MPETKHTVQKWAFQLNSTPTAAETWDLKGHILKVNMGGFHSSQQP
jgi:hypothetical protein